MYVDLGSNQAVTAADGSFSMDAAPLNLERPEVPVEVAALVAKMMAKEPSRRFQTPGEVARMLLPYFKTSASQRVGSGAEVSRVNPQVASAQPSRAGLAPNQPATESAATAGPRRCCREMRGCT